MTITFSIFRLCRLLFLYAAFSPFFFVQAQHKKKNLFYDREKTKLQAVYYVLGNNQNVIDSIYEEYYDNGQVRSRGNYRMNKPIGLWEYFHENGALRMKGEIQDFQNNGYWTYYYENGAKYMDKVYPSPAPKETIDVSGAGDTFTAAFTLKYLQTKSIEEAITPRVAKNCA